MRLLKIYYNSEHVLRMTLCFFKAFNLSSLSVKLVEIAVFVFANVD